MAAVYFGDEYEDAVTNSKGETIQLSKISKQGAGFRLLEELGTDPRVYFLPPANRKYAAPGEPKPPKA
jgi:molybdopterin-containing oxidoreductase family iron-sulfur binding subunit